MVPEEVMNIELNMFWQDVFTWASWIIALVMMGIAVVKARREKTLFYPIVILAVGVGAYIEPLYDVAFDLWFFDVHNGEPGAMYSHFTAFGIVQPVWTHSGYIILYATACLYAGKMIYEGRMTPPLLFTIWIAEITASCVFEVIGTGVGVYSYYGPYVLRIWNYPLVIGVLEGTQVVLFTLLAVQIWRRVKTSFGLVSIFLLFPITMMGANTGVGGPIVVALHLEGIDEGSTAIWLATLLTLTLCAITVYGCSRFLPGSERSYEQKDLRTAGYAA